MEHESEEMHRLAHKLERVTLVHEYDVQPAAGHGLLAGGLLRRGRVDRSRCRWPAAQCDQTVGQSIDSYLSRHPDVKAAPAVQSQAEGGGGDVIGYLNRHPDVRQHLIDLSQQCTPISE